MAAYAALLSLFHTLNHIKIHPRPPISIDQEQLHTLTQNLTFFLDFLELHPSYEDDDLERRIKAAAYAAEDVIETHIVDQIHAGSTSHGENIRSVDLHRGLERVMGDMDLIKNEVMEIMIKEKIKGSQHHQLHTNSSVSTASAGQSIITARFDDALFNKVLDKLMGQQRGLQIIPIVGMGGIGKTTFAKYIYSNLLIVQHFDILAWITISQVYSRRNIVQVLCQEVRGSINGLSGMSEDEIGLILYQHLYGRRYLIVMDDIWSVEAWDKVKSFFPDNNDGSRIMITTRLSNIAFQLSGSHDFHMQFLDEDKSWDLLCKIVFGKLDCPVELENVGKEIARNCRGLPLSITVIGGLLAKSNMTRVYWEYSLHHLNSLVNLEDNEYCLQVLRTSYKELPVHLKPCFLYMGVFPEDSKIKVSELIKLWVSEGILKPNDDKTLEEVGEEYLKELIYRNLILVHELRWNGKAKICKLHDLLRDICSREAKKQKFLCVVRQQKQQTPQGINKERRICIVVENAEEECSPDFLLAMESASLTRSLLYSKCAYGDKYSPSPRSELLRVYTSIDIGSRFFTGPKNTIFEHANLRYLSLKLDSTPILRLPSLRSLWNLQTLKVFYLHSRMVPSEIWEMPLLRHVMLSQFVLPDPPNGEDNFVLENLQTLSIMNLKFSEEVVKRIPNVKKLKVKYESGVQEEERMSNFCLNNLDHLQKLESFNLNFFSIYICDIKNPQRRLLSFPHSLKMLTLRDTMLSWEECMSKIGSLPLLEYLILNKGACCGPKWSTVEESFCSLKVLEISVIDDLKYWETDSAHFPRLEHLRLQYLQKLKEIPSSIGDIPTLQSIRLQSCRKSASDSARRIKEEQEDYGNADLQVIIDQVDSDGQEDQANWDDPGDEFWNF